MSNISEYQNEIDELVKVKQELDTKISQLQCLIYLESNESPNWEYKQEFELEVTEIMKGMN